MQGKNYIFYLINSGISVLAALNITISYALLNIFIPEDNLPLEIGIARAFGEQVASIVNVIMDIIIWFIIFILIYRIYKRLGSKKFIIFLILSPIVWMIGTYVIVLVEIFILNDFKIDIFGSSCGGGGYPIGRSTCYENVLYGFYFLNISFWFLMIWFTWEKLIKRIFRAKP